MQNPDLKLIQSFLAFASSKNINEAAAKLHISQPAMTSHLKSFEEQLPQKIFAMQGRKKTLNKLGQELFLQLNEKFKDVETTIDGVLLRHSSQSQAHIKIGGRKEILARVLADLKFTANIEAIDCDSKTAVEWVLNAKIDLALMQKRPDSLNLVTKHLFKDQFQLLTPRKMNFIATALSKKLLTELSSQPFLSYKPELTELGPLREHYKVTEAQNIFRTFADWQVLIKMCEKGMGWTLAPSSFVADKNKCDSFLISTELLQATDFFLVYPKANAKIPWFADLATQIKEIF